MQNISYYIIIGFIVVVFSYGLIKKVNVYNCFIKGAFDSLKEGIQILPYLLCMFVAINVFNTSGILNDLINFKRLPSELFIQGMFRPVSSHASLSMMLSIFKQYGVDSDVSIVSSILQGGSDTTIYVMGLYFGSIGLKKTKHAYVVGIISDIFCFLLCLIVLFLFFNNWFFIILSRKNINFDEI